MIKGLNFKIIKYEENYFSNEILLVIKKNSNVSEKFVKIKEFYNFIKLEKIKNRLKKLKGKFYVFGTSINSAFIDYFIKEKNLGFVDENPEKECLSIRKFFYPPICKKKKKIIFSYSRNKNLKKKTNENLKKKFDFNLN